MRQLEATLAGRVTSARVSIIVPVRNRPDLLVRCLESLVKQSMDRELFEIVVCDDGSTEDLSECIARFQPGLPVIRLERQSTLGPAAARNLGIRRTASPVLVFVDSDVLAGESMIQILVEALVENPEWAGVEACLTPVGGDEGPLWDAPAAVEGGRFHTAAIAYRREALISAGGLDESFRLPACEDVELAARVLSRGVIGFAPAAKAYHPRRSINLAVHWRWRRHWRYVVYLAKRYGFLAFPGEAAGPFPRIRVALAAVLTLPLGRLRAGIRHMRRNAPEGMRSCLYAVFDAVCGIGSLPGILFCRIPPRRDYLSPWQVAPEPPPKRLEQKVGRVAVVVSAHRIYPTLELCLAGFRAMVANDRDLFFVNNGSCEKLGRLIAKRFPSITAINLKTNLLFCAGYNAGIRAALDRNYDYILVVNADTEIFNPQFLEELLETAHRQPRAAFIGPLVFYRNPGTIQNTCQSFPSIIQKATYWLPWRLFRSLLPRQPSKEIQVEFLNGVCVLCRSAALREIGLMDERFGGYVEDADWSWRARRKGWNSLFVPVPSVIHHEDPTGYEHFSLKSFLLKRNTVLWFLQVGNRTSARMYAKASLGLAWLRMQCARTLAEKQEHAYFIQKLKRSYQGLLRGEEPGSWFGPPLSAWK
jgi:GT2 family glycosyltransferase